MKRPRLLLAAGAATALLLAGATPAPAASTATTTTTPSTWKSAIKARAAHPAARSMASTGPTGSTAAALPAGGFGNGIFRVYVEKNEGFGVGSFTVLTGPDHPAGAGLDVLFGGGVPGTTFMTVRDLTDKIDHVQSQYITMPTEVPLDTAYWTQNAIGTTGFHTHWSDFTSTGQMVIDQNLVVHGTTLADSSVEVTTTITGASTNSFQIQYLWDTASGADDGPVIQTVGTGGAYNPFAAPTTSETTLTAVDSVALADNDGGPATPTLSYGLTGTGPSRITPPPTPPQSIQYLCWPRAVGAAPGAYQTDPTIDVAASGTGCQGSSGPDSAVQYLFSPATIGTAGVRASASIFSSPATPDPTSIKVAAAKIGTPALSATLTDTRYNRPVAGRTLTFTTGSRTLCSAVTNPSGVASCGGASEGLAALLGYSASYAGDAIWAASTGKR